MFNFNLYNPTRIIFGKDQFGAIDKYVPKDANVLITYGGGSAIKNGVMDKVKNALGQRKIVMFGGIEPNPQYSTLIKAVDVIKKENITYVMAVGGGSVIDGTKFILLAVGYKGNPTELLYGGFKKYTEEQVGKPLSYGAVLTLPATGSEMNCGAVISHEHGKYGVQSDLVYPAFSILDPTVTATLPKIQVANGIVDTFVHTTEQYITYPVDARIQDRMSEGILQTLIEIGETSVNEPDNYAVRANHVWASTMALNGYIGVGVPQDWSVHMIGHELTARFGIDHGQTLAIVLPYMLRVRKEKKRAKLLQYAEKVWGLTSGSDDEKIDLAINKTEEFFNSLGIKTKLSEYGVKREEIAEVVEQLKAHGMVKLSESGDLTPDIVQTILEKAF